MVGLERHLFSIRREAKRPISEFFPSPTCVKTFYSDPRVTLGSPYEAIDRPPIALRCPHCRVRVQEEEKKSSHGSPRFLPLVARSGAGKTATVSFLFVGYKCLLPPPPSPHPS